MLLRIFIKYSFDKFFLFPYTQATENKSDKRNIAQHLIIEVRDFFMSDIITTQSTLDCGVKLVTFQKPGWHSSAVSHTWDVGSHNEHPHHAGITHFMEHLLGVGSGKLSKDELTTLTNPWGDFNARTWHNRTDIIFDLAHPKYLAETLEIIEERRQLKAFTPEKLENERERIVVEQMEPISTPEGRANWENYEVLYPNQRAGISLGGLPDILRKMTYDQLVEHWKAYFGDNNSTLYIATGMSHEDAKEIANQVYKPTSEARAAIAANANYVGGNYRLEIPENGLCQICLAFETYGQKTRMLSIPLPGVMSAYINRKLSSEISDQSIAYHSNANFDTLTNTGTYQFSLTCEPHKVDQAIKATIRVINELQQSGCNQDDIQNITAGFERADLHEMDSAPTNLLPSFIKEYMASGRIRTREESQAAMDGITVETVNAYIRKIFSSKPSLGIWGKGAESALSYAKVEQMLRYKDKPKVTLRPDQAPGGDRQNTGG